MSKWVIPVRLIGENPFNRLEETMKYLCLIYDNEQEWQKFPADVQQKYMGEYGTFTDSIKKSGRFVGANQLQPTHTATTVRARNGKLSTTDGPYAETKEQLGGFYILDCKNLDEALEYAKKIPGAAHGSVEVRPIMVFG
jgi:hypothetical protein